MKIASVVKVSVFAAVLVFAALLPATVRAQADAMPESFAFSAEEAAVTQQASSQVSTNNFERHKSLPYDVKCEGKNRKAGRYSPSVKSDGISHIVTIRGSDENVNWHVHQVAKAPAKVRANHDRGQHER